MSIRPQLIALALAASLATVAGCSSSSDAGASPTSTTTPSTSTSAPPSSPSKTTSSPPTTGKGTAAGAPGVPEPARQHTTAGAIAFAKHYVHLINTTGNHPRVGVLEPLAASGCKTCKNYEGNVEDLAKEKEHNSASAVAYHSAHRIIGESGMVVEAMVDQTPIDVLRTDGTTDTHYPLIKNFGMVFFLKWSSTGWRVQEIKIDDSTSTSS